MKKQKHILNSPHLEIERGLEITKTEYRLLKHVLPALGFAFTKKSRITDFVVPATGKVTRRTRIEWIKKSEDGSTGLHCLPCLKNHPIKGKKGKHVRRENEKRVSASQALVSIMRQIDKLEAPIPYYSKKRWHFEGTHKGYHFTIALDHAVGLGKYSGYYMEIETILKEGSTKIEVRRALKVIRKLARRLIGEKRPSKISYRRMLMGTWTFKRPKKSKKAKKLGKAKKSYRKLLKKFVAAEGSSFEPNGSGSASSKREE